MHTLESLPEIVEVRPSEVSVSNRNYDLTRFRPESQTIVVWILEELEKELSKPYLLDPFRSHVDRRAWLEGDKTTSAVYDANNCLRGAVGHNILAITEELERDYTYQDSFYALTQDIIELKPRLGHAVYDKLDTDEKVIFNRDLKLKGKAILDFLTIEQQP